MQVKEVVSSIIENITCNNSVCCLQLPVAKVPAVSAGTCKSKSTIKILMQKPYIPSTSAHPAVNVRRVNMRRLVGESKTILVTDADRLGREPWASGR